MPLHKNKIDAEYLREHCGDYWSDITVFDQIDSTNSWLKNQKNSPAVCLAESQTQGRGRNGNHWLSPDAENIYLSFNWVFESKPQHLPLLSLCIGVVIAETIESLGLGGHGIKWPNDLYWMHKKLGGILIETSGASSEVIVGIGINANASVLDDVDQPWTSLSEIAGVQIDRNQFLRELLKALRVAMVSFPALKVDELKSHWAKWDLIQGKAISFLQDGEARNGIARGIDDSGYLLVEMGSGEIKVFNTTISKVRW